MEEYGTICKVGKNRLGGDTMKSIYYEPNLQGESQGRKWFKNVKLIGEISAGTSIYIEDYAYTYLNQCANSDRSYEVATVLIGECHKESDQVVIYGVIPIDANLLDKEAQWIDENVLDVIEEKRKQYFPKGEYVGWMHTQPGYGIMPTTKEKAIHLDFFGRECVLMLIDPVYEVEAFYTMENNKLEEKTGFCIYYEKNELMQKYMEDHPFTGEKEQGESEKVVEDFRTLGARRKQAVQEQRKKNRLINIALVGTLLAGAFIIGIQSQQKKIDKLQRDVVDIHQQYTEIENRLPNSPVELVFTSSKPETQVGQEPQPQVEEEGQEPKQEPEQQTQDKLEEDQEKEAGQQEPEIAEEVADQTPAQLGYDIHQVEAGESLLSISYNYYKTLGMAKEIATLNQIENHDTIYIGQKLKLPKKAQ